jgi:dienelactone hydrolase
VERATELRTGVANPIEIERMVKILDLRFDQIMGRFGFIVGAIILVAAIAGFFIAFRWGSASRAIHAALVAALVIGCLLFGSAATRIASAAWRFAFLPPPPRPSGPLPVETAIVSLPPISGEGAAITVQIWYPAAAPAYGGVAPIDPVALGERRLAKPSTPARYPMLLYAPGLNGPRDDNASTSASLASHGFIVVAIDDIDHAKPLDPAQPFFNFSSGAAFEATLIRGADKAAREARHALNALDRLEASVSGAWREQVQFERVGFFGFSYGAAVAAIGAILDPRVAAAANLDGWVFGPALTGSIEKPCLLLIEDEPVPGPHTLNSPDPGTRYYAILQQRFLIEQARLVELPDKYGFQFRNVAHDNFTDWAFSREAFKSWLFVDPARIRAAKDAYLVSFFAHYLRDEPKTLLTQKPSPYQGVDVLKGRPHWSDGKQKVPILVWMGLR